MYRTWQNVWIELLQVLYIHTWYEKYDKIYKFE